MEQTIIHTTEPSEIKPTDLVLDVRTSAEHDKILLAMPHWHVPLSRLKPDRFISDHCLDGRQTLYLLCRSGFRATKAAEKFIRMGYTNVSVINGGVMNAEQAGLAVVRPHAWPMERQVRVAVGLIIVAGFLLAQLAGPIFYLIPFLLGLILIIGGITGYCPMIALLSEMPWNT